LNAALGVVHAANADLALTHPQARRLASELLWMQHKLFDAGGILATAAGQTFAHMPTITDDDVTRLEHLMDDCQSELTPLQEFILPGGGKVSSLLHFARTICRRAERVCVRLAREEAVDPNIVKFINRLSDALFVLARWVAKTQNEPEVLWQRTTGQQAKPT
jgi:cob(I)alamin adenosyltransferase